MGDLEGCEFMKVRSNEGFALGLSGPNYCDMQVWVTLRAVSSWKWVAKRVVQPIDSMRCSDMAQANPKPS